MENVDDVELRDRARLFSNRCRELEGILRANETHLGDISGEEFRYDVNDNFEMKRRLKMSPLLPSGSKLPSK